MVGARTNLWHTIGTVKAPDAEIVRSLRTFTGWSEALPEADLRTDESLEELNGELEMVHRVEPTPIHEGPYVEKVELQNGHEWRQTEEGTWCRFSPGPPDCFGIGPTGPRPVEAPTVEAAPTNVPEEAPRAAGEPTKPPTAGAEQRVSPAGIRAGLS